MNLTVTNSIVHHIYQDTNGQFGIRFSTELLSANAEVTSLVNDFNQVYNAKPVKGYASFPVPNEGVPVTDDVGVQSAFPGLLNSWLDTSCSFMEFSREVAELLKTGLESYAFSESGFLLMADYETTGDRFLVVSFLPVRDGVMVQPDLRVQKSAQLDIHRIQVAARINLTEYQANMDDGFYVSFVKGRSGRRISEFFLDFLGCVERVNAKASTTQLVHTIDSFVNAAQVPGEMASELKQEVYDYCGQQWEHGDHVRLTELDARLVERGAPSLVAFAEEKGIDVADAFPADRSSLRQLLKFQGQGGGLSLSFDQSLLGHRIHYDADTDQLTIKGTPPNLRDQLRRYLGLND